MVFHLPPSPQSIPSKNFLSYKSFKTEKYSRVKSLVLHCNTLLLKCINPPLGFTV